MAASKPNVYSDVQVSRACTDKIQPKYQGLSGALQVVRREHLRFLERSLAFLRHQGIEAILAGRSNTG